MRVRVYVDGFNLYFGGKRLTRSASQPVGWKWLEGSAGGSPVSPNTGSVTTVGRLGITLGGAADAGFDITSTGVAYAALTTAADSLTRLYTINLTTVRPLRRPHWRRCRRGSLAHHPAAAPAAAGR